MTDRDHMMVAHLYAAQEEDVAFLIATGSTHEQACARVGVNPQVFRERLQRRDARLG